MGHHDQSTSKLATNLLKRIWTPRTSEQIVTPLLTFRWFQALAYQISLPSQDLGYVGGLCPGLPRSGLVGTQRFSAWESSQREDCESRVLTPRKNVGTATLWYKFQLFT